MLELLTINFLLPHERTSQLRVLWLINPIEDILAEARTLAEILYYDIDWPDSDERFSLMNITLTSCPIICMFFITNTALGRPEGPDSRSSSRSIFSDVKLPQNYNKCH